jgi:small multidrug resistance family-3 protein
VAWLPPSSTGVPRLPDPLRRIRHRVEVRGPADVPAAANAMFGTAASRPPAGQTAAMIVLRSIALFVLAAVAEIGGARLVWQGVREHWGLAWIGAGVVALGAYGFVATLQPDPHFGRILAAYGDVFVAGSLAWGMVVDGSAPTAGTCSVLPCASSASA